MKNKTVETEQLLVWRETIFAWLKTTISRLDGTELIEVKPLTFSQELPSPLFSCMFKPREDDWTEPVNDGDMNAEIAREINLVEREQDRQYVIDDAHNYADVNVELTVESRGSSIVFYAPEGEYIAPGDSVRALGVEVPGVNEPDWQHRARNDDDQLWQLYLDRESRREMEMYLASIGNRTERGRAQSSDDFLS
jgi:hypothetical protein